MKQYFNFLTDFLFMRTKKSRIANCLISGLAAIYVVILFYPNFLFGYSVEYKHFKVYSTQALNDNIYKILDKAENNLSSSEIYDRNLAQNVYLCNNYPLYSFLAPIARKAFAFNYPLIYNIFVAYGDIDKDESYKHNDQDKYTRRLSQLIAHETTHTLIGKRLGYWKQITLSKWKKEGYCECVGYNKMVAMKDAKEFFATDKTGNSPGATYRKYYYAVAYLKDIEQMTFDDILATDLTFEQVLKNIEQTTD